MTMIIAACFIPACVGGGGTGTPLPNNFANPIPPIQGFGPDDGPEPAPGSDRPPASQPPPTQTAEPELPGRSPRTVDYEVAYASNEPVWDVVVNEDDDGNPIWGIAVKTDGSGILIGTKEAVGIVGNGDAELGEGISAEEMVGFFIYESDQKPRYAVTRWGAPPEIRMGAEASDEDRRDIMLAVRMINSALPPDWQITVESTGADVPEGYTRRLRGHSLNPENWIIPGYSAYDYNATEIGYIDILFEEGENWIVGNRNANGTAIPIYSTSELEEVLSTRIYVDPEKTRTSDGEQRVSVMLEEILHALGRPDHGRSGNYNSILKYGAAEGFLRALDEAALIAVYGTPLPIGKQAEDGETYIELDGLDNLLTAEDFGPWSTVPYHASDEVAYSGTDPLRFGAIWRYGQPRPYMMGMDATGAIADTSGRASWSGKLVGLTPEAETVRGDMGMAVDFGATVTGSLEFTKLVKGVAKKGLAPNAEGTPWMGGDGTLTENRLDYGITVDTASGLFFQSGNDDDAGLITGAFFGSGLGGVGGTLRRSDLAAGFGGRKQEP